MEGGGGDSGTGFKGNDNLCGRTLLHLSASGSSILAELLRLSQNIPDIFVESSAAKRFEPILFGFDYLKHSEDCERRMNATAGMLDLDQELIDSYQTILMRFYRLFESIVNYVEEYNEFLTNLASGIFIRYTTESVLQHTHGKQLMCECLYLFGTMLLLLEHHIPGPIRERIVVAVLRHNGEATLEKFEDVSKLIRSTGVQHSTDGKPRNRPKDYPEKYFARFRVDTGLVKLIVQCLQSDDIYNGVHAFPSPEHRSTRLATQAGMLYVTLYFAPELLCSDEGAMRGLVDKHFSETWVIAVYMGHVVDLSIEWKPYRAATKALANILTSENVGRAASQNIKWCREAKAELSEFLTEGVLSEQYLLVHMESLLQCMRKSNVALRWQLLHRRCWQPKFAEMIRGQISDNEVMDLLLQCAQLEYQVREMFTVLLGAKMTKWVESRTACVGRLNELSKYFSGEMALTRVRRDDRMVQWFAGLSKEVGSMFNVDEESGMGGNGTQHSTVLGRKIEKTILALEDVEQFEQVDTDDQIKQFLADTREQLRQMIRVVNINRQDLTKMEVITDLSYGFEVLKNYTRTIHERVRTEPSYSVLLRAGFVKLSSILDVPLTRINEIGSPDLVSVSQFYSGELVDLMRRVLDIIPRSVFEILQKIIEVQTLRLKPLPVKFESERLKEFSQLDERYRLARMTNKASTFTEGILAMESTGDGQGFYIGVNKVDARSILHDGLRKELVRQVCEAMHATLVFISPTGTPLNVGCNVKELAAVRESFDRCMWALANRMDGFRRSIEYVQDYVDMAGLKMWQEELSRIVNYNIEQECNRYIKKKVLDYNSKYQSKIIPIPRFAVPSSKDYGSLNNDAINFMGRAMNCLLAMTEPSTTIFAPEAIGWFTADGEEICGIKTFATLQRGINVTGLAGLDRLLAFRVVHELGFFLGFYKATVKEYLPRLEQIRDALHPTCRSPPEAAKLYAASLKKLEKLMSPTLRAILKIGQAQLIRRQLSHVLHFSCRLDANLLYQSLSTLNAAVLGDVQEHYRCPAAKPYPNTESNPLLGQLNRLLEASGMSEPFSKIYVVTEPLESLPVLLLFFVVIYMSKFSFDAQFATLVRRKSAYALDGMPFVVGLWTLLKQFHPSYTRMFLAYLGQFVCATVGDAGSRAGMSSSKAGLPGEVANMLLFLDMFCKVGEIPQSALAEFIPPHIMHM